MNRRVRNSAAYVRKNIKITMTKKDFYEWCDTQRPFIWFLQSIGCTPSIDRIDSNGNYEIANIRILSVSENSKNKTKNWSKNSKPIIATKDGVEMYFRGAHSSECMDFFGRNRHRDIVRCLKKQPNKLGYIRTSVCGWSFKYV